MIYRIGEIVKVKNTDNLKLGVLGKVVGVEYNEELKERYYNVKLLDVNQKIEKYCFDRLEKL